MKQIILHSSSLQDSEVPIQYSSERQKRSQKILGYEPSWLSGTFDRGCDFPGTPLRYLSGPSLSGPVNLR